jgi:hypothetical protein
MDPSGQDVDLPFYFVATGPAHADAGPWARESSSLAWISFHKHNLGPTVNRCSYEARHEVPGLKGSLVLHLKLDASGTIVDARASSADALAPPMMDCIVGALRGSLGPASANGTEFDFTLRF